MDYLWKGWWWKQMALDYFKVMLFPGPWAPWHCREVPTSPCLIPVPLVATPWESSSGPWPEEMLMHSPMRHQIVPKQHWAPCRAGTCDVTEESQHLEGWQNAFASYTLESEGDLASRRLTFTPVWSLSKSTHLSVVTDSFCWKWGKC